MYDFLIKYSEQLKGVAQQTGNYLCGPNGGKMARVSEEAKEALYDEVIKPIATAITGEIKSKVGRFSTFGSPRTKRLFLNWDRFRGFGAKIRQSPALHRGLCCGTPGSYQLAIPPWPSARSFHGASGSGGVNVGLGKLGLSLASIAHHYTIVITLTIVGIALLKQVADWINRLQGFETPEDIEARRNRTTSGYSPEGMLRPCIRVIRSRKRSGSWSASG